VAIKYFGWGEVFRSSLSIIRGASSDRHSDERTMQPMQGYWVYMTGADTLAGIGA